MTRVERSVKVIALIFVTLILGLSACNRSSFTQSQTLPSITASSGKSVTTSPTVPTLVSILVSPNPPNTMWANDPEITLQFMATGNYADGSMKVITSQVTWSSSNPAIATISPAGIVSTVSMENLGSTTITASLSGITSAPVTLTVGVHPTPSYPPSST